MKRLLITFLVLIPINSLASLDKDVFSRVENYVSVLQKEGIERIVSLVIDRVPSQTYGTADTCYDCKSGFVFWQRNDTTFLKKFNSYFDFEIEYEIINSQHSTWSIASFFRFIDLKEKALYFQRIRPTDSIWTDSSSFDIILGDTIYNTVKTSRSYCAGCKHTFLKIINDDFILSQDWTQNMLNHTSNPDFADKNLTSATFQLYSLMLLTINHYERNKFFIKVNDGY